MKIDNYLEPSPLRDTIGAAAAAADLGYDGLFTAETSHDPFLPLALAAAEDCDLDFGTAIAVAFPRSPMVMAMKTWDLAELSGGRFILGLGTQIKTHITRRFSTPWDSPGPRLRDYIGALRAIWHAWQTGDRLDYGGEYYQFSLMTPFFDPGPSEFADIPVAIAGVGPYLSRLAGEICDGFHVHPFHTVSYLDSVVLPNMAAGAASTDRSLADCARIATVFVVTGETAEQKDTAMAAARQQIAFYASTPSYAPVLEANGWDFGPQLTAMSKRGEWEEMARLVDEEVVAQVGVVADIHEVGGAIRERYGDRIQRVGIYGLGGLTALSDEALRQIIGDISASED